MCYVPLLALGHVEASSRRLSGVGSAPIASQTGELEKSQMLSFGRVQEITVYISSGITNISKLSVFFPFGSPCGGGNGLKTE